MALTAEQTLNARSIISAVRARGYGTWWQWLAITVALSESSLINVGHGDYLNNDTIGLFQQDASYGTREQRLDPQHATNAFLDQAHRTLKYRGYRNLILDGLPRDAGAPDAWVHVVGQRIEQSEFNNETWPNRGWLAWGANYLGNYPLARQIVADLGDKMQLRDTSDNGYTVLQGQWDDKRLTTVDTGLKNPAGDPIRTLILDGPTARLAVWSINQWNAKVEPVYTAESFDYRPKRDASDNPSEHATGRAWDVNAPSHPLDRGNAGSLAGWHMSAAQKDAVEAICDSTNFDGKGRLIRPGGEWGDGMHLEETPLNPGESEAARDARISDFLAGVSGGSNHAPQPLPHGGFLMALSDDKQDEIYEVLMDLKKNGIAKGQKSVGQTIASTLGVAQSVKNDTNGIRGSVSALKVGVSALVSTVKAAITGKKG